MSALFTRNMQIASEKTNSDEKNGFITRKEKDVKKMKLINEGTHQLLYKYKDERKNDWERSTKHERKRAYIYSVAYQNGAKKETKKGREVR